MGTLTAEELLAGGALTHEAEIPAELLSNGSDGPANGPSPPHAISRSVVSPR